jgi:hypothetical protein
MIQRKQTLFLLMAAILALVCLFVRLTWLDTLQALSAVLSLATIFLYKKRILQARLCLAGLFVIFIWYIGLAVWQGCLLTTIDCLPMINAILIFMARKGILDDEKLVRSLDRIR